MTTQNARRRTRLEADRRDDERFDEAFHTILREAAERREERQRAQSLEESASDRQAAKDLLSLVRVSGADS